MDKRLTDVIAYFSWPGLLIAFFFGDRYRSRFHINQSLVIWVALTVLSVASKVIRFVGHALPLIGWSVSLAGGLLCGACTVFCICCLFISFINAVQGVEKKVPLLGQFSLI